jgi:tetratricopeptide (TPR) repeat protein
MGNAFVLNMASHAVVGELIDRALDQDLPSCDSGIRPSAVRNWLMDAKGHGEDRIWARVYWLEGRCAELVERVSSADPIVHWLRATAFQGLGQLDQAAVAYRSAGAEDYPEKRARQTLDAGDQAAVWSWLDVALRAHPTRWVAEKLAAREISRNQQGPAVGMWESLAHARPENDEDHWWALGQAAELKNDIVAAADLYAQGAPLSKFPYAFWMRSGDLFLQASAWISATQSYTRAAQARPDLIYPLMGLGHIEFRQQNHAVALAWYERADQVQPGAHWPAHFEGQVYYAAGELSAALERFSQAEREAPNMLWNQYYLARTLYALDRAPEAFVYIDRALNSDIPKPITWLTTTGEWLTSIGERERASQAFRLALKADPTDEHLLFRMQQFINP